ncbi:MAG: argininosuccinate lyase, partial [Acidimicrobiia bacterium]|nr:argininosuccinate lyase [Acidimicrobiia bacterium]
MKDVFGRLSKGPHPELHRLLYAPAFDHDVREVLPLLVRINAAHVVMLEQCGILDAAEAAALLRANDAIAADPPAAPESSRGLYAVFEAELISRCGPIAGGSVHTARSRNDINATVARLRVRACLLRVAGDLLALQSALIERAAEHRASLMPGFTHLQPAQPTTFGHYLLGVAAEFDRTASRLLDVDGRMDECPMGACAGFGTSLPIRPHLVADLLGFARPVPSALDAVASRDFVPEFLSIAALAGMTLTRLATDLQSWASPAWGFLGWPDELVSTSSIMPQKRNAFVLESLRGRAAGAAGGWVSAMVGMKNTPFANGIEVSSDVVEHAPRAAADTSTALQLMTLLMRHVTVDAGRLEAAAGSGDITATALADALVRSAGVAFRAAHEAVAGLVTADVDR